MKASRTTAFTLIELLVVISIMGLIASLAVPALKNMGKSNSQAGASRQLLDDVGRARQLAISQHTTVYMVFVPTNFFNLLSGYTTPPNQNMLTALGQITTAADRQTALLTYSNLNSSQLSGYNFIAYGRVGDQPGQHSWHYLSDWQSLPNGTFISAPKFSPPSYQAMYIPAWEADYPVQIDEGGPAGSVRQIVGFTNCFVPFPTAQSPSSYLPCIAFDYTGRLISEFDGINYHHAYIPLSQGTVSTGVDVNKRPLLSTLSANSINEIPPGNSTSIGYNIVDVDPLSGRARLLYHHIQ